MVTLPSFNPYATTQASGLFSSDTTGAIQGLMVADPSARYRLSQGYVDQNETQPIWGGISISEHIGQLPGMGANTAQAQSSNNGRMGSALKRATSPSDMTGFAVYDHANHMVITSNSNAPQAFPGNSIGFARFGSNVRLAVPADPALLNQVGALTNGSFGWDFANQRLTTGTSNDSIPVRLLEIYETGGLIATINPSNGGLEWQRTEDATNGSILALIQL